MCEQQCINCNKRILYNNLFLNNKLKKNPEESGSATDIALLKFMSRCGVNIE